MEIIVLTIGVIALSVTSIIVLSIVIYNQMLMVNEINKRLLLIAKESQERERYTMSELEEWIRSTGNPDAPLPKPSIDTEEESFDPFTAQASRNLDETEL